jgi:hypothetical protein
MLSNGTLQSAPVNKRRLAINRIVHRLRESIAAMVGWLGSRALEPGARSVRVPISKDLEVSRSGGRN